jgi:3' terminal RNA ribose 2'-O-methyltransferase Hen1
MLLTISTSHKPATDLGYLLHKSPGRVHSFPLAFGEAHVFYPEASDEACTAALLVEVDPVGLVRRPKGAGSEAGLIRQYVNDRPYAASSMLSTAISSVYGTAMSGRSKQREELADAALPLVAEIPAAPSHGGDALLRELFEPLGYEVHAQPILLSPRFPDWGDSRYLRVRLTASTRVRDLLTHLYVLLPVLDDDKHYWIGSDEVDKLLRAGAGWLERHPCKDLIASRYLRRRRPFVREALARLYEAEGAEAPVQEEELPAQDEAIERLSLGEQRMGSVLAALKACGARRVLDIGCGEGKLLLRLAREPQFEELLGVDVSYRLVSDAKDETDRLPAPLRRKVSVEQGSLLYRDQRLEGWDAACLVEVIEHVEPGRLPALERNVFEFARPRTVIVTTPNVEYNACFDTLAGGRPRHPDHRFEWTRAQFVEWAERVAAAYGYAARILTIGPIDAEAGSPTQMAVFSWS